MAYWIYDEADYHILRQKDGGSMFIHVEGVLDVTASERPKLIIENHPKFTKSLYEDQVLRNECIQTLAAGMKVEPHDAEWYTRDSQGRLQSISINYHYSVQEDPQYSNLLRRGTLDDNALRDAKANFPDITVEELRTAVQSVDPGQKQKLERAFENSNTFGVEQQDESPTKSGYERGLSCQ